ncbi:hypothetical protein [Caldilinea sp.]|uniref:hypothetical protein n=1 Tax=Caldilinea sp. TaxID=2293560 RepID=UPI002C0E4FDC|nr:hypothetical protein [Anaerolineales bacterium]HQY94404.1 hypothetical protein [Caldilinea sp.]HRA66036.1 hypothetical protein [Caldilinea sp.]
MTQNTLTHPAHLDVQAALPLLRLLNPKQYTRIVLASLAVGLIASYTAVALGWLPLWGATAMVLLILAPAGALKWRDDYRRYGATIMGLSILLTAQGLHTVEHLVQWAQYNLLYWTMRQSNGLLSPANAEWVHFTWNWLVLITVVLLMLGGMRGGWMWVLLTVAIFHTIEHSYTFIRYQMILRELTAMDVLNVTAQGLPGIVGRDGWLARSEWTRGTWICTIPGLTTAVRLDVHFWWNILEMTPLILAGHFYLRGQAAAGKFE